MKMERPWAPVLISAVEGIILSQYHALSGSLGIFFFEYLWIDTVFIAIIAFSNIIGQAPCSLLEIGQSTCQQQCVPLFIFTLITSLPSSRVYSLKSSMICWDLASRLFPDADMMQDRIENNMYHSFLNDIENLGRAIEERKIILNALW